MTYPDYKDAAERHLETCYSIYNKLVEIEDKKQHGGINLSEERTRNNLLANLYYLSGYMVECLYSYAMCKYEDKILNHTIRDNDIKALDDRDPSNPYFVTQCPMCMNITGGNYANLYTHTYKLCFTHSKKANLRVRYSITRKQHRMSMSELSYFHTENVSDISNVPLFDNLTVLSNQDLMVLFNNWSAFERYKINYFSTANFPIFDHQLVLKFFWELVDACFKLSKHIIREDTLFRKIIKKRPANF